ncbi:unnamed protein product [Notodromas monacha]|uniref:C2H2-type domain-containing protein n=1 Tax=Notodromas monacha TaxID=399045 RepID=A0A7R9BG48_9CRUS|nr:unnamed protein product [Notodromas monacha]CAG0913844.1 unnamed protein product [Notodromas monacha]
MRVCLWLIGVLGVASAVCVWIFQSFILLNPPELLVYIVSARENFHHRERLRSEIRLDDDTIDFKFVIGSQGCDIPRFKRATEWDCRGIPVGADHNSMFVYESNVRDDVVYAGFSWRAFVDSFVTTISVTKENACSEIVILEANSQEVIGTLEFNIPAVMNGSLPASKSVKLFFPRASEAVFICTNSFSNFSSESFRSSAKLFSVGEITAMYSSSSDIPSEYVVNSRLLFSISVEKQPISEDSQMFHARSDAEHRSVSDLIESQIQNEILTHQDILLAPIMDTYANLTLKLIHALTDFMESRASFLMKLDDDVLPNLSDILSTLRRLPSHEKAFCMSKFRKRRAVQRHGKWADLLYSSSMYPAFPCGAGYILNRPAAEMLVRNAQNLRKYRNRFTMSSDGVPSDAIPCQMLPPAQISFLQPFTGAGTANQFVPVLLTDAAECRRMFFTSVPSVVQNLPLENHRPTRLTSGTQTGIREDEADSDVSIASMRRGNRKKKKKRRRMQLLGALIELLQSMDDSSSSSEEENEESMRLIVGKSGKIKVLPSPASPSESACSKRRGLTQNAQLEEETENSHDLSPCDMESEAAFPSPEAASEAWQVSVEANNESPDKFQVASEAKAVESLPQVEVEQYAVAVEPSMSPHGSNSWHVPVAASQSNKTSNFAPDIERISSNANFPPEHFETEPSAGVSDWKAENHFKIVDNLSKIVNKFEANEEELEHGLTAEPESADLLWQEHFITVNSRIGRNTAEHVFRVGKIAGNDEAFKCMECGKIFKQLRYFRCHAMSFHRGFTCERCGAVVYGRFRFSKHRATHTQEDLKVPLEPVTKKRLVKAKPKKDLRDDSASHRTSVFSCFSCSEIFVTEAKLRWHEEERHGTRKHVCGICSVSFMHKALLNRHFLTVHPGSAEAQTAGGQACVLCHKVVKNMSLHLAVHVTNKPWKCNVCGRGFSHKCNLVAHSYTHKKAEDRPFVCSLCGAGFLRQSSLNDHLSAHKAFGRGTNPKILPKHLRKPRHVCSICNRAFFLRRTLSRHLIRHSIPNQKKVFPCPTCNRVFSVKEYLVRHLQVHDESRPFRMDSNDVTATRNSLKNVLGSKFPLYLSLFRRWFKSSMSKDEFDAQAEELLTTQHLYLHNRLVLGILEKCCVTMGSSSMFSMDVKTEAPDVNVARGDLKTEVKLEAKEVESRHRPTKSRKKSRRMAYEVKFRPQDPVDILMSGSAFSDGVKHGRVEHQFSLHYALREQCLLDPFLIHGRILTLSYEKDITEVADSVAELVTNALKQMLKNILQSIVKSRKSYKADGLFSCTELDKQMRSNAMDANAEPEETPAEIDLVPDCAEVMFPRFPMPRDEGLARAATLAASCASVARYEPGKITAWDLFDTLLRDPGVLPLHNIRTLCLTSAAMALEPVSLHPVGRVNPLD